MAEFYKTFGNYILLTPERYIVHIVRIVKSIPNNVFLVLSLFYSIFNQYCRMVVITLLSADAVKLIENFFQWLVVKHPCLQNVGCHAFVQTIRTE